MARKRLEEEEGSHEGCHCCCCGYGGGRRGFWKGVLVGLLAAWAVSRLWCGHMGMCRGMSCGYGYGQPAVMEKAPPPPTPRK